MDVRFIKPSSGNNWAGLYVTVKFSCNIRTLKNWAKIKKTTSNRSRQITIQTKTNRRNEERPFNHSHDNRRALVVTTRLGCLMIKVYPTSPQAPYYSGFTITETTTRQTISWPTNKAWEDHAEYHKSWCYVTSNFMCTTRDKQSSSSANKKYRKAFIGQSTLLIKG